VAAERAKESWQRALGRAQRRARIYTPPFPLTPPPQFLAADDDQSGEEHVKPIEHADLGMSEAAKSRDEARREEKHTRLSYIEKHGTHDDNDRSHDGQPDMLHRFVGRAFGFRPSPVWSADRFAGNATAAAATEAVPTEGGE
jgi:hypothetical protein